VLDVEFVVFVLVEVDVDSFDLFRNEKNFVVCAYNVWFWLFSIDIYSSVVAYEEFETFNYYDEFKVTTYTGSKLSYYYKILLF
jgi:hypothetical protein